MVSEKLNNSQKILRLEEKPLGFSKNLKNLYFLVYAHPFSPLDFSLPDFTPFIILLCLQGFLIFLPLTGKVGYTIYSFICLSAGAIEWQPCCIATILLLYVPSQVMLQCQCYLLPLEVVFSSLLYRQAFIGFSCCFSGLFYALHFILLSFLQHALTK